MKLKSLVRRIAQQRQEDFPFPEDIESYVEDFVPNILLKSETLQKAFGVKPYELEKLYEEAFNLYEKNKYSDALIIFKWLVLLNTYEEKYWIGYGATQQLLKNYDRALHAYAVAALLNHANPYPHFYAYECYDLLNNKNDAKKALLLAKERCVNNAYYKELEEEIIKINKRDLSCKVES